MKYKKKNENFVFYIDIPKISVYYNYTDRKSRTEEG